MRNWTSHGVTLDHCDSCKGLWFDAGELTQHLANLRSGSPEPCLVPAGATGLDCPRCRTFKLERVRYGTIEVDRCKNCRGLFLDVGELHELLGAFARPRLEAEGDREASHFDNFGLGLYVGMQLHSGRR
jgi:Zn-finger nucleic acid-binding protein